MRSLIMNTPEYIHTHTLTQHRYIRWWIHQLKANKVTHSFSDSFVGRSWVRACMLWCAIVLVLGRALCWNSRQVNRKLEMEVLVSAKPYGNCLNSAELVAVRERSVCNSNITSNNNSGNSSSTNNDGSSMKLRLKSS